MSDVTIYANTRQNGFFVGWDNKFSQIERGSHDHFVYTGDMLSLPVGWYSITLLPQHEQQARRLTQQVSRIYKLPHLDACATSALEREHADIAGAIHDISREIWENYLNRSGIQS